MRLRVSNPALLPDLLEFLRSRVDVVAEEVSDDEVEVSLVGSYNSDALRMELYLRVRAWEAGRRSAGVEVELVDLKSRRVQVHVGRTPCSHAVTRTRARASALHRLRARAFVLSSGP